MKLEVEEGGTYDAETRKDTANEVQIRTKNSSRDCQERRSGTAICRRSSDNATSVLTRKPRLPDGRIGREMLKTGILRIIDGKSDP